MRSIADWALGGDTSPIPPDAPVETMGGSEKPKPPAPASDMSSPTPAADKSGSSSETGAIGGSETVTGGEKVADGSGGSSSEKPTEETGESKAGAGKSDGKEEGKTTGEKETDAGKTEAPVPPEESTETKGSTTKETTGIPVETKTPEVLRQESIVRGMVGDGHKGEQSGIVEIAMKQLQHDAEKFGYEGNEAGKEAWAKTKAIEMAEAQGFIRPDGDTRLGTAAIGRISEVVERSPDGKLHIVFVDTQAPGTTIEPEKLIGEKTTLFYHETDTTPSPKEEEKNAIKEKGIEDRTTETKTRSPLASEGGTKLSPEVSATYESLDAYKAVKQEGINLLGGRVKFIYGEGGEIPIDTDGTITLGKDDITSAEKLLKMDWNRDLPKLFSWSGEAESIAQTHETNVKEAAQETYVRLSLLQELEKQGLGETPEATFLRREILTEIKKQESVSGGAGSIFNRNDTRIASLFKKESPRPWGV